MHAFFQTAGFRYLSKNLGAPSLLDALRISYTDSIVNFIAVVIECILREGMHAYIITYS